MQPIRNHVLILVLFVLVAQVFVTPAGAASFDCRQGSKNIDVSLCPGYADYADNPGGNATVFFRQVFARMFRPASFTSLRRNENVTIRIPAVTFYFRSTGDGVDYLDLSGYNCGRDFSCLQNLVILGATQGSRITTFQVNEDGTNPTVFFHVDKGENLTLKNLYFKVDNRVRFDFPVISIDNTRGDVVIDHVLCSGTKANRNGCLRIINTSLPYPYWASRVELTDSRFSDYFTGAVMDRALEVTIEDNVFDNSQATSADVGGNVDLVLNNVNYENDRHLASTVKTNTFLQDLNGSTNGETGLGIIGATSNLIVKDNTFRYIRDTGMYMASHNPEDPILGESRCVGGGPQNVTVTSNAFYATKLNSVQIENLPVPTSVGTAACPDATMGDIVITKNTIENLIDPLTPGGGIAVAASDPAPIYGLSISENLIKNAWRIEDPTPPYDTYQGACLNLAGLQGENGDFGDITVTKNTLVNCELAVYLRRSYWPRAPRPAQLTDGNTRDNRYLTITKNTLMQPEPTTLDFLYQFQSAAYNGVQDLSLLQVYKNPPQGANRCNASCQADADCHNVETPSNTRDLPAYDDGLYACQNNRCQASFCQN